MGIYHNVFSTYEARYRKEVFFFFPGRFGQMRKRDGKINTKRRKSFFDINSFFFSLKNKLVEMKGREYERHSDKIVRKEKKH